MRVIETFITYVPRENIRRSANYFVQDSSNHNGHYLSQHSHEPAHQEGFHGCWYSEGYISGTQVKAPLSTDAAETVVTREELMRAYDLVEQGYTLWFGGECPVGDGVIVDVVFRLINSPVGTDDGSFYRWSKKDVSTDIIAYRISQLNNKEATCGEKYDSQKPRFSLVPTKALTDVIDVLEFGAKRYGAENWLKVDNAQERYFNAAMRHLMSWHKGELSDDESGLPHLAHAATCLMFRIEGNEK